MGEDIWLNDAFSAFKFIYHMDDFGYEFKSLDKDLLLGYVRGFYKE